jgi:hypothetical protein
MRSVSLPVRGTGVGCGAAAAAGLAEAAAAGLAKTAAAGLGEAAMPGLARGLATADGLAIAPALAAGDALATATAAGLLGAALAAAVAGGGAVAAGAAAGACAHAATSSGRASTTYASRRLVAGSAPGLKLVMRGSKPRCSEVDELRRAWRLRMHNVPEASNRRRIRPSLSTAPSGGLLDVRSFSRSCCLAPQRSTRPGSRTLACPSRPCIIIC